MFDHNKYMQRCIYLAEKGLGLTYPNPLVGAIIIYNNKIIGEGFHVKSGNTHAEVIAIQSVKNKKLLSKSTLYINLEPCNHFGKTSPCTDFIIKHHIPKVIIGIKDPNTIINGKGIKKLKSLGVKVIIGICKSECNELNKRFLTFHKKKRPYIFLKFAKSLDGFLNSSYHKQKIPFYISNIYSLQNIHYRRTQEQAIIIGKNTAIHDNPKLDTRLVGNINLPIRIILDRNLNTLNYSLNLFTTQQKTLIYNIKKNHNFYNVNCIQLPKKNFLHNILDDLMKKNIQSIIIEGGEKILSAFIKENLWDEAEIYIGNIIIKKGIKAPFLTGELIEKYSIVNDNLIKIKNNSINK